MKWAMVVPPEGAIRMEEVPTEELAWLQEQVGGYIEGVYVEGPPELSLFVNEEGFPYKLPFNLRASQIASKTLVGVAVVMGGVDPKTGDTMGVPLQFDTVLWGVLWGSE